MPLEAGRIERNEHTLQRVSGNRRDLDDAGSLLDHDDLSVIPRAMTRQIA